MIVALAVLCAATAFSDPYTRRRAKATEESEGHTCGRSQAISAQDNNGDTALHQAALHGQ